MSTPAQKANLARIRDNQRRSRARRREYIAELEQRLRNFELEGVAASSEVQLAARRVAEENRQLRELLHKHGFQDEYISQFLLQQAGSTDPGSGHRFSAGDPVQALQQIISPRRPMLLDTGLPFPMPNQVTREMASASLSAGSAAPWDPQQVAMPSFGHPQVVPPGPHPYASPAFTEGPAAAPPPLRTISYQSLNPSGSLAEDVSQHSENAAAINFNIPMSPYHNAAVRDFPPPVPAPPPPPPPPGGGYY
ncbi:hypothetical protein Trco_004035 [Trichoderma cornu-damae]|uniref:BZIP domain-containing protein n=1 Tax=Trichoderma cornu-damae TaxID=654480 RepID=A0A9P8QSH7_9HYPO|nr:hypothetical protein Trco_004035 [Trichoderma cornu-damae]